MCECKNVEIGSYTNQTILSSPNWDRNDICVDTCLKDEILKLWSLGGVTTGCCCGHNKVEPMINVDKNSIKLMEIMGYNYTINKFGIKCFKPKSV